MSSTDLEFTGVINDFTGSYLGFMFDDIHSSELGLVRTSDGSRYIENFLPDFQDRTAQANGTDGTYYYGTYFNKRNFTLNVAFEHLTDSQIREIKRRFSDRNLHKLVFDETPYKYYWVKCSSTPTFKMLAFDTYLDMATHTYDELPTRYDNKADLYHQVSPAFYEGSARTNVTGRIYKGEATINFVAYDPFAHSFEKFIDQYTINTVPAWGKYYYIDDAISNLNEWGAVSNFAEWRDSVHLLRSDFVGKANGGTSGDNYLIDLAQHSSNNLNNKNVLVYNPGDYPTPFKFRLMSNSPGPTIPQIHYYFQPQTGGTYPDGVIVENPDGLTVDRFTLDSTDYGVQINTKLHLIEGLDENGELTGKVYNKYILSGDFFKIPVTPTYGVCLLLRVRHSGAGHDSLMSNLTAEIQYDYLYY